MSADIRESSQADFAKAIKKNQLAILPVGSLEQHGPHLPVSTDSIISEYLARQTASRLGAFLFPTINYGVSFEHAPMFNISVTHSVLSALVCDVCSSIAANGMTKIVIINGHHGNMGALQYVAQDLQGRVPAGTCINTIHYWHLLKEGFDHAGEVETSLILAIAPQLVRMDKAEANAKKLAKSKTAYSSLTNAPGSFTEITGNGVWGNPKNATAEKGKQLINEIVKDLSKTILELDA